MYNIENLKLKINPELNLVAIREKYFCVRAPLKFLLHVSRFLINRKTEISYTTDL